MNIKKNLCFFLKTFLWFSDVFIVVQKQVNPGPVESQIQSNRDHPVLFKLSLQNHINQCVLPY